MSDDIHEKRVSAFARTVGCMGGALVWDRLNMLHFLIYTSLLFYIEKFFTHSAKERA